MVVHFRPAMAMGYRALLVFIFYFWCLRNEWEVSGFVCHFGSIKFASHAIFDVFCLCWLNMLNSQSTAFLFAHIETDCIVLYENGVKRKLKLKHCLLQLTSGINSCLCDFLSIKIVSDVTFLIFALIHRGSQEQQPQPRPQEMSTDSWYPPSVMSSPSSSRPTTPGSSSFARPTDRPNSLSNVSPTEAAGIIAILKDKRWAIFLVCFRCYQCFYLVITIFFFL